MIVPLPRLRSALIPIFFLFATLSPSFAQLDEREAFTQTIAKMKERQWQAALDILNPFLEQPENKNAFENIGPKFGWFWYHKGYCEYALKMYDEAMESFETCYSAFANAPDARSKNPYDKYSLLKWADVARDSKNYELAAELYVKFLEEKDPDNPIDQRFSKGSFYISLAICQFKSNELKKGLDALTVAIKNKNKFPTTQSAILEGFSSFLEAAVAAENEKAILSFVSEYGSTLGEEEVEAYKASKKLLVRAAEATQRGMGDAAFQILALIPETQVIINEMKATEEAFDGYKGSRSYRDGGFVYDPKKYKELRKKVEEELRGAEPNEATALYLSAVLWSASGNQRAAYATYEELETNYSKSKNRESNLLNLIKTTKNLGKSLETEQYGNSFIKAFPDSTYLADVRGMMISSLYFAGDYEQSLSIAYAQLDELEKTKPSESHDMCLFVIGGANHNLGKYAEAGKYLALHIDQYPESKFIEQSEFMSAANAFRSGQLAQAGKLLDAYLEKFAASQSNLIPFALFYRANIHYIEQEPQKCLARISELEEGYLSSSIMASSFNLKGNVLQTEGELKRAEQYYKRALERAEKNGDLRVAGEACNYLLMLLTSGDQPQDRAKEAVSYYDLFWEKFARGSQLQAEVAYTSLEPMRKVGRADEGLEKMADIITQVAKMNGQPKLEQLVNSYRDAYLAKNGFDKLKTHFYDFEGISSEDREALAMLRVSLIGAYEEERGKIKNEDKDGLLRIDANIKALFADLKSEFKPEILSSYSLYKIGDYIRTKTATPKESIAYYEEIMRRNDPKFMYDALFGLADLYADSKQSAEVAKAEGYLNKIYNEVSKTASRQAALGRLVDLYISTKVWEKANKRALEYLEEKKFTKNRPLLAYYYALSFDKMGNEIDALSAYNKVRSANMGYITVSAPSTLRMMEIWWKQNRPSTGSAPSTRQAAYNQGWLFIDATRRSFDRFSPPEKKVWREVEALVKKYENSGDVVTMAEQEEAKKN